jgi:TusA-related sulfurtransferase
MMRFFLSWKTRGGNMSELIDAKGLGCAEPVILAKRALELHDKITIVVDEQTALENLRVFGMHAKCLVKVAVEPGKAYSVHLKKIEEKFSYEAAY